MADDGWPPRVRVLITNDDGIHSAGLLELVDAVCSTGLCDVCVIAPEAERSAVSHCIELHRPLEARPIHIRDDVPAYQVTGYPADCVMLAVSGQLFDGTKPSLVLSGINRGANVGMNIHYSGTVAAAREALICGLPGIAISLDTDGLSDGAVGATLQKEDYRRAAQYVLPLLRRAIQSCAGSGPVAMFVPQGQVPLALTNLDPGQPSEDRGIRRKSIMDNLNRFPPTTFLNVNVPSRSQIKGVRFTRQGLYTIIPRFVVVPREKLAPTASVVAKENGVDATEAGGIEDANKAKRPRLPSSVDGEPDNVRCFQHTIAATIEDPISSLNIDSRCLAAGYVSITPLEIHANVADPDVLDAARDWVAEAFPNNFVAAETKAAAAQAVDGRDGQGAPAEGDKQNFETLPSGGGLTYTLAPASSTHHHVSAPPRLLSEFFTSLPKGGDDPGS